MATRLINVVVDSADPQRLGRWWATALGWDVIDDSADETDVASPEHLVGDGFPELVFLPVDDPRTGPLGLHLDLSSTSTADQQATVDRLIAAGARHADVGQSADSAFVVLADPEGNEFCVLEPRGIYLDTGPIAAIVMNVADPAALAVFWETASGWSRVHDEDGLVQFRHRSGQGPFFELMHVDRERPEKLRVHLDIAPMIGDDQSADVARLAALGARSVDIGQLGPDGHRLPETNWEVMVDPGGHQFCVLRPR